MRRVLLTFKTGETIVLDVQESAYEFLQRAVAEGIKIKECVTLTAGSVPGTRDDI